MSWVWVVEAVVLAAHDEQLAEHGGATGVRDAALLDSALARPLNLAAYGDPDVAALAAAYGYGIVRNHAFIDGNKRMALVISETFLALNGWELTASDAACVTTILAVADGAMAEADFAEWVRGNIRRD